MPIPDKPEITDYNIQIRLRRIKGQKFDRSRRRRTLNLQSTIDNLQSMLVVICLNPHFFATYCQIKWTNGLFTLPFHQCHFFIVPIHKRRGRETETQINNHDHGDPFKGLTGLIDGRPGNRYKIWVTDGDGQRAVFG